MRFKTASEVEQVCYEFKLADYPRGKNRALINDLFNGVPPYTGEEVAANDININVNFLGGTRIGHDARSQFANIFLRPGKYFSAKTDMGPKHKRSERSAIVTRELAKIMKRSSVYYETFRSKFALDVLHGIGPSGWDTDDHWCPDALGIEDVLVPSNTLLTMKNLPFFAKYRSYTAPELIKLTRDEERAKAAGWNMDMVNKVIAWIDEESHTLMGNNWPEVWSPEKSAERVKSDGGFYAGDRVPTCDVFDFYYYDCEDKQEGWKRKIILDAWSTPSNSNTMARNGKLDFAKNQFLFDSRGRYVASSWKNVIAFQFADLSAVAPFRYHSVRSLGWLLYAVVNLQNRMRCKFNECVFENMMMLFRVKTMDEAERALKLNLINKGFIDETLQFIPAADRFQVNAGLVQLGLGENERIINDHSAIYAQNPSQFASDRTEKTKFQVMAELQAMTAMISSAVQQAYRYQEFEYQEIFRRFCMRDSRDPDVNLFRARCMKQGVPETLLVPDAWELDPEKVLGAGNRTLELAISEQMMQFRNLYDPDAQRTILRDFTQALTEDPGRADDLVPSSPTQVTDSVLAAQYAAGTLMQGLPVGMKNGINHIEYVDTILISLQVEIGRINQNGGVPTPEKLEGLQNLMQHIERHIAIVSMDENEKERVTNWQKLMSKMGNLIRAFAQRLQEQMQQQQQQGPQSDPKDQAKIQSMMMMAQAKAENTRESHAQRTAQRAVQFQMEMQQKEAEHKAKLNQDGSATNVELAAQQHGHVIDIAAKKHKAMLEVEKARAMAEAAKEEPDGQTD